jgi:hypothetical protein
MHYAWFGISSAQFNILTTSILFVYEVVKLVIATESR